eukprot:1886932-Pyramimonas_sp.AAC.1
MGHNSARDIVGSWAIGFSRRFLILLHVSEGHPIANRNPWRRFIRLHCPQTRAFFRQASQPERRNDIPLAIGH